MDDLIRRQDAIDVVEGIDSYFVKYIEQLPSAQPEIIRCKDCKNYTDVFDIGRIFEKGECEKLYLDTVRPDDFCSWAERREE